MATRSLYAILDSYARISPPAASPSDHHTAARELAPSCPVGKSGFYPVPSIAPRDTHFAEVANALISELLGQEPSGASVLEPDSVLGESGRLYHGYKEGTYYLPNDAAEQDRLDLQHEVFRMLFDGWMALAPLTTSPKFVLDIGTGTGGWYTILHPCVSEQNPDSLVIGTDLSAIEPHPRFPNCAFVKADAEDSWVLPDANPDRSTCAPDQICEHFIKFDYVHLRMVVSCFNDTQKVISYAYANMNPNGLIEFQDSSFDFQQANPEYKTDAFYRLGRDCAKGAAAIGQDVTKASKYKSWLEEAGFVDVVEKKYIFPFSPWPKEPRLKEVGLYNLKNAYDGLRGAGWKLLRSAGYTPEDIETLIRNVQAELRDPECLPYSKM
ncbi:S-adenosyl-L-methionine-dependent methyltransferase [Xylariales sp. PMI_506]|nr:S-adenosyl-L-methionine-dependent methyltransferase [Xylariales sp. PMI_506]